MMKLIRVARAREGRHQSPRRTPVPRGQVPVRPDQGALARTGQEHDTAAHTVCVDQLVDGPRKAGSTGRVNPPNDGQRGLKEED